MDRFENYYAILECEPYASAGAVNFAYQNAAKKYYPNVNSTPDAQEKFRKINEAYTALRDPNKKAVYDVLLKKVLEYERSKQRVKSSSQSNTTYRYSYGNNSTSSTQANTGGSYSSSATSEFAKPGKAGKAKSRLLPILVGIVLVLIVIGSIAVFESLKSKPAATSTAAAVSSSASGTTEAQFSQSGSIITEVITSVGGQVQLEYSIPDGYSIRYEDNGVMKPEFVSDQLYITGLKAGNSTIAIFDSQGNSAASCRIVVNEASGNASTAASEITIEKHSMTINVGDILQIDYLVPDGGSVRSEDTAVFNIVNVSDSDQIVIHALAEGTASFDIYDGSGVKTAECTVTVNPVVSMSAADVPFKLEGYTAEELEAMGFSETVTADGTRAYPGFYQAPNGNYYSVN